MNERTISLKALLLAFLAGAAIVGVVLALTSSPSGVCYHGPNRQRTCLSTDQVRQQVNRINQNVARINATEPSLTP